MHLPAETHRLHATEEISNFLRGLLGGIEPDLRIGFGPTRVRGGKFIRARGLGEDLS